MNRLPPFAVVFGPTASGKSSLARRLHEHLHQGTEKHTAGGIEVISADSMQVYRGMDIGTAKPPPRERDLFPHHLTDIRNPDEPFTVGDFVELAEEAIRAAGSRGALPVVVGGTAFYLRCLLCGMPETPRSDAGVRGTIEEELAEYGSARLRHELEQVDPQSAARIAPADEYRLVRAIEVYRLTGRSRSSFGMPVTLRDEARDAVVVGLSWPRELLYQRINARVEEMAREGLREELASLLRRGYGSGDPGLRAIGYREYLESAEENISLKDSPDPRSTHVRSPGVSAETPPLPLDEVVVPRIQRNTRRFAKRQITFFRAFEQVRWIDGREPETAAGSILDALGRKCGG